MTDIETLPMGDAMTAADLVAHSSEIRKIVGSKCEVYISTHAYGGDAGVQIYPLGICGHGDDQFLYGATWADALQKAYTWARAYGPTQRNAAIRRMALAIIELTDEHRKCTREMLRCRWFSDTDLDAYCDAACQRAGEMAGNAPFVVEA